MRSTFQLGFEKRGRGRKVLEAVGHVLEAFIAAGGPLRKVECKC